MASFLFNADSLNRAADKKKGFLSCAFVILAAGSGTRLGGASKQFRLLSGRPLWRWSLELAERLRARGHVSEICLVLPPDQDLRRWREMLGQNVAVVHGGATRSLSVLQALKACVSDCVFLHDSARPFADEALCVRLLDAFTGQNAVIPLLSESNALKRLDGHRLSAVNRDGLMITQTPQLFPRQKLLGYLASASDYSLKDEAELWLQNGERLDWAEGSRMNFKVTDKGDWIMAQHIAEHRETRTGIGYDVHPMSPGRALVLGGIRIPSPLGLVGHSDADALCHAIADALLSASGLPDIGTLYPASDERYRGADSTLLLADTLNKVRTQGWTVDWISAVVSVQSPKLAPWHDVMTHRLNEIMQANVVSVTFKSGEHVGPAGNNEALFVWVSATVSRIYSLT